MDDSERLRLEYDRAADVVENLTEVRFKLLALVPTLAGIVLSLASSHTRPVELLAIGALGATATLGILVYELRNAQIRGVAAGRVRAFEARTFSGGALVPPPASAGGVVLGHRLGVALVYGAAFAGWAYLLAWGALGALGLDSARSVGLGVGAVFGALAARRIAQLESTAGETPAAASQPV